MSIQYKSKQFIRAQADQLFIRSAGLRVADVDYAGEGKRILKGLRVCFVKQETFGDLYTNPTFRGKDLLFSTVHRSGPIGLFDAGTFDFFIIKLSESQEGRVWKYLKTDMNGPSEAEILAFKDKSITTGSGAMISSHPQSSVAVSMEDIKWSEYDVVISINFSVDERIVQKNRKVLWCYILQEPSMRHYRESMTRPLFSYDLFLNQKFTYQFSFRKKHEINFPYNLMHSESFHDLTNIGNLVRNGVFIEIHSVQNTERHHFDALRQFGEPEFPSEEPFQNVLAKMLRTKYFLSLRGKHLFFKIWGNSMIDAVAAGLLAFGNPKEYHNLGLFTPFTTISSFDEFYSKIKYLETHADGYKRELALQRKLLDKYCFYVPVKKLQNAYYKKCLA